MTREEAIKQLNAWAMRGDTVPVVAIHMAIEALTQDSRKVTQESDLIVSAEAVDCTDFILWLLNEIMDEENWELNAVAYGEIIARKLKKLGLLEVKDGYYVRTQSAEAVLLDIEKWRTWSHTYDNMCKERLKEEYDLVGIPESCKKCNNHPSNGGSGICHCTLGSNIIRW